MNQGRNSFVSLMLFTHVSLAASTWVMANRPIGMNSQWNQVASNGQIAVAVGNGGMITTSQDGLNWSVPKSIVNQNLYAVAAKSDTLIAVGDSGVVLSSTDGQNWVTQSVPTKARLYGVMADQHGFLAVGDSLTILRSVDCKSWQKPSSQGIDTLYSIASSGQEYLAVGSSGVVLRSTDGNSWSRLSAGPDNTLYSVIWNGQKFIAGGYNLWAYNCYGLILSSADGNSWTQSFSGTFKEIIRSVVSTPTGVLAVGYYGTILRSTDLTSWQTESSPSTQQLRTVDVLWGKEVAAGNAGTLIINDLSTSIMNVNTPAFNLQVLDNQLQVNLPDAKPVELSIYNTQGQMIWSKKSVFSKEILDLNWFNTGKYYLFIRSRSQQSVVDFTLTESSFTRN